MKFSIVIKILLLTFITIFLIGCWDYKEYEEMALIFAIGFDNVPGQSDINVTIEYLVAGSGGEKASGKQSSSTPQGVVYTAVSPTIETAIDKLQEGIPRQLFFEYTRVIVIGEDAARNNMQMIMNFLINTPRIHDYAYMFVAPGKASDILGTDNEYDKKSASEAIFNLAKQTTINSFPDKLGSFKRTIFTDGIEPTASKLTLESISGSDTSNQTENSPESTKTDSSNEDEKKKDSTLKNTDLAKIIEKQPGLVTISGMAAFQGRKMVGWLNEQESRGWAFITNRNITGYKYVYEIPGTAEENKLSFHLLKIKSKISTRIYNEQITIILDIHATGSFEDHLPTDSEFVGPVEVAVIEQYLEQCIRADVESALHKGQQELKTDIFGFGFAFFRQHYQEWQRGIDKEWAQCYPELPVQINVNTKIVNSGIKIRFD